VNDYFSLATIPNWIICILLFLLDYQKVIIVFEFDLKLKFVLKNQLTCDEPINFKKSFQLEMLLASS
jgi:hypothetical protein